MKGIGHTFKGDGNWCQFLYAGADGECLGPCGDDLAAHGLPTPEWVCPTPEEDL